MDSNIHYEYLIEENIERGFQVKLVVNEFREVEYLQLRKYFLSYEGEWLPSKEGVSIPLSLENVKILLRGVLDLCSKAEAMEEIKPYLIEALNEAIDEQDNRVSRQS